MISYSIEKKAINGSRARAACITTPHGDIHTPAFIPVGTKATVKALTPEQVRDNVGAEAVLANTYHLYLQPGIDVLKKAGGLHKFMNWNGPTFTDSGGFQAFSLSGGMQRQRKVAKTGEPDSDSDQNENTVGLAKVTDDGVTFKSVIDGSTHEFTPERSIEIQHAIGADIIFAFDECISPHESYERQKQAVERTRVWAQRCLDYHNANNKSGAQSLFGIVQGGRYEDLRKQSVKDIGSMEGFEGFGIGGSFDKDDIGTAVGWVTDALPENKPRHLLGIGEPADIILGIENGIDTFDCVAPTRLARNGAAYVDIKERLNLFNAASVNDFGPIQKGCECYTCKNYTRAYLSHLFRAKEMLAATLTSIHNLYFVVNLAKEARKAIVEGKWEEFKKENS